MAFLSKQTLLMTVAALFGVVVLSLSVLKSNIAFFENSPSRWRIKRTTPPRSDAAATKAIHSQDGSEESTIGFSGVVKNDTTPLVAPSSSYTNPVPELALGTTKPDDLPVPIQVMEQYKKWHGIDSLRSENDLARRKFAVVFYSCPLQAGNRLHHFMTGTDLEYVPNDCLLGQPTHTLLQEPCGPFSRIAQSCGSTGTMTLASSMDRNSALQFVNPQTMFRAVIVF